MALRDQKAGSSVISVSGRAAEFFIGKVAHGDEVVG
jgi:hypothetical protein